MLLSGEVPATWRKNFVQNVAIDIETSNDNGLHTMVHGQPCMPNWATCLRDSGTYMKLLRVRITPCRFFFFFPPLFSRRRSGWSCFFFLAVLLGSFQACAIYIPAAPDVQGDRAKSKPLLLRGGRGLGWSWVGGGAPRRAHRAWLGFSLTYVFKRVGTFLDQWTIASNSTLQCFRPTFAFLNLGIGAVQMARAMQWCWPRLPKRRGFLIGCGVC